jgi:hypothetical protein
MARTRPVRQSPPDVQTWVDNISLGAIEQTDQHDETLQTAAGPNLHNASELSTSRNGSNDSINQSDLPVSGIVQATRSVSRSIDSPAPATVPSRSRSSQLVAGNVGLDLRTSGISRGNNSLLQLETAHVPLETQLNLPPSRSSSLNSVATVTGTKPVTSSFEQLGQLQAVNPAKVPLPADAELHLPQSHTSSRGSGVGVGSVNAFGDSLEQLHNLLPLTPSAIPLPMSNGSGPFNMTEPSIVAPPNEASHVPDLDKRDYWQRIKPLTQFMPHLKAILPPKGRHRLTGKITCVDYLSNGDSRADTTIDMNHVRSQSGREMMTDRLKKLRTVEDPLVRSRIILVEDLCSEYMEMLGISFELDPEFFAEHLNRSGYEAEDYSETDAERWNTSQLGKDFVAITWCRPVYQNPLLTDWLRAPRKLLDKDLDRSDGVSGVTWRDPVFTAGGKRNRLAREHRLRVDTNIFRRSWSLSAGTAGLGGQLRATDRRSKKPLDELRSTLVPTAWQERASFCRIQGDPNVPIGKRSGLLTCRFGTPLKRLQESSYLTLCPR